MDISAIMIHVDASPQSAARLSHAVAIATAFHATLIGLLSQNADDSAGTDRHHDGKACGGTSQLTSQSTVMRPDWRSTPRRST